MGTSWEGCQRSQGDKITLSQAKYSLFNIIFRLQMVLILRKGVFGDTCYLPVLFTQSQKFHGDKSIPLSCQIGLIPFFYIHSRPPMILIWWKDVFGDICYLYCSPQFQKFHGDKNIPPSMPSRTNLFFNIHSRLPMILIWWKDVFGDICYLYCSPQSQSIPQSFSNWKWSRWKMETTVSPYQVGIL